MVQNRVWDPPIANVEKMCSKLRSVRLPIDLNQPSGTHSEGQSENAEFTPGSEYTGRSPRDVGRRTSGVARFPRGPARAKRTADLQPAALTSFIDCPGLTPM